MQKANSTLNWAWQASLGLLLMLAVPILGAAQTFSGTGLPLPANEDVGCTTSTLEVTTDGTIGTNASIDQVELDITHTWDGDLEITLISPATTRLTLSDGNGGSGDNYTGTIFDDAAATSITAGSPPFTGTFLPQGGTFATTFATESIAGIWTLEVCDDTGGDSGTFNSWGMTVTGVDLTDITFCVDFSCVSDTPGFASQGIGFDFNSFNSGLSAPLVDQGDNIWCGTYSLAPGEVRYNFFFAGANAAGGPEDLSGLNGESCTSTLNGEVKRSYTVVEGVEETVTFAWESCDETVEECPAELTDITFCVDFSCEVDEVGFAAQGLEASFNNFNSGGPAGEMTNAGGNVWCRTDALPAGDIRFGFFFASAESGAAPEDLTDLPCASDGDGGWKRDYTVVEGVPETLTFAYNSCEPEPDCAEELTEITFCVDFECEAEEVGFAAQGLEASFNGFNSGGPAGEMTNTMGTLWCRTDELPAGDIRFGFFYASAESGAAPEDLTDLPCASDGAGGWKRDYTVVAGVPETLIFAYNSCEEVPDCGPDGAEVEFCVDVSCWPEDVQTVNVFGNNFPDGFFNPTGHPMTEDDPGIYCTTIFLPSGDTEYKFLVNGTAEVFDQGDPCTTTFIGGGGEIFTNRLINVEAGVNQSVLFGMDSCDDTCAPRSLIEFCVDIGCIMPTGPVTVFGTFEPFGNGLFFNPTATPLMDPDGDDIYCASVPLRPGDVEFKFLINAATPQQIEEQFQVGDPCTVSCCGGMFTNRVHTVMEDVDESLGFVFNQPCEGTFDEPTVVFEDLDPVCDLGFTFSIAGGATPTGGVYSGTGITDNGDGETFTVDFSVVDPGDLTVTYTLAGELNCVYTETAILPVLDCNTEITDPCTCNDDASQIVFDPVTGGYNNPNDGTFGEVVAISSPAGLPAGLDFRVVGVAGTIGANVGDVLAYDAASMSYQIAFDHADDVGYTITIDQFFGGQAVGFNFSIGNTCAYPNPVFDPELDPIYCSFQDAITLGGDDTDGIGADAITFTINGAPATAFDPMDLGPGLHEIVMTYDGAADGNGGVSPDGGVTPAFPGCIQEVVTTIEVEELAVGCIGNINVTLGEDCGADITPQMVLTGSFDCADDFNITVDGTNDNKIVGCGDHTYMIEVIVEGEVVYTCWGDIFAEDKTDPVLECPDDTDVVINADFDIQTAEGTIDATDPTIELADYSCFLSLFDPVAGPYGYDLIEFTVSATDVYNIVVDGDVADQTFISVFAGDFNPDNPCENILGGTEGAWAPGLFFGGPAIFNFFNQNFRVPLIMEPGQTYTIMVASNDLPNDYTVAIVADNGSTVSGGGFAAPEPVMLEVPLYCEDLDLIEFVFPVSWIVNGDGSLDATATRALNDWTQAELDDFLNKLGLTGIPVATDNCGQSIVTVSDVQDSSGDCGDLTITRTFTAADRWDGACVGDPRTVSCTQVLTFTRPDLFADLANPNPDFVLPPLTSTLECDEAFETDGAVGGPDDNPSAAAAGQPFILTASGYQPLDPSYCNIGASYSDEPRIEICEGSYSFRREWTFVNWCAPDENFIYDQFVKVKDFTGPAITGIPGVINVSTSPFSCEANVLIPIPDVADANGCSSASATSYTVLAFGEAFFAGGNIADGDVVSAPIGEHILILCAVDACGNETCEEYELNVSDEIEPTAVCNDELNVSIGGGDVANGVEGIARVFAVDFDEGSNDNCSEVTLEVRRNFWRNGTCDASANRFSPWGEFVDFYCCDIGNEITIELRVTDAAGNQNICWEVVTPEDKINPFCYAPDGVTLTCAELPLTFPGNIQDAYDEDFAGTSQMMDAIFGGASGTDNCAVDTIVERTPNIQINECGWGTITRRFEAWQLRPEGDVNGNGAIDINEVFRSTNSCSQRIDITEVHDFVIDFPEDADADCGDPEVPTIITDGIGCDVLSVNIGDPVVFEATGDECYKYSITYDVINWCLWDGEYDGYVIPRMTEDDGEPLPVDRAVEGNERPVVTYNDNDGLCIDRRHNDRDGDSFLSNCESPQLPNFGRYIYTQFVKVYDSTSPTVEVGEYGGPTDNCPDLEPGQFGDDDGNCEEAVSIPFSVADDCELFDGDGNLVVSIVSAELDAFAVDANGDGDIKSNEFVADFDVAANITDNGDGTYSFDGVFPIIPNSMGDNVVHALRVLFEDGCGNQVSEYIEFDVIDCKGPAPVCINGLTVTLMPTEEGGCAMAIWASDFEGSPISDCTGQGPELFGGLPVVNKYAIYRASTVEADPNFVPSPDDTGLVLTEDDEETTVVYVYAFDEDGNYDFCETYILVQQHVDCGNGTGTLSGVIATEDNVTVEGVEVSVNGTEQQSMITNADGTFSFILDLGGDYTITPYLNAEPLNGVSTFDLVLMSKHILGVQPLDSPYKRIAADVNNSQTISTLDLIQLRKLILNIETEFQNNTSWRFVDASYNFPQPANPWFELFPELINENDLLADILNADFVGVKIGDVNGSVQANALANDDRNLNGEFNFAVENGSLVAGNVYTVAFRGAEMNAIEGFQGTLNLNGVELVDIEYGVATAENFGMRYADQGMITTSWNGEASAEDVLFSLVVRATDNIELSDAISVNNRYTEAEAYGNGNTMNVGVVFSSGEVVGAGFEVYQNTPNPFRAETLIGFNLPEDAEVTLTVSDASGRTLTVLRGDYAAGYNTINLQKSQIQGASGVLSYTISTDDYTATKKMVVLK